MRSTGKEATRSGAMLAPSRSLPRIRFINLDRASERRRFMETQGRALGLVFERAPAVAADRIAPAAAQRLNNRWERPLTPAELGCFLSHEALWRDIAEGVDPVLVLEDDVMLSRRVRDSLPDLVALMEVDFLNLEDFGRRRFVARARRRLPAGLSVVRVYRDKSGSAAYLLWPSGARKLLRRAEAGGAAPVDAFLHGLKALVSFQTEPALAMQLHLLEARGITPPISAASSIQAPRARLSLRPRHLGFLWRRLATQARLALDHASLLFGRRYRRIAIDPADFCDQSRS